MTTYQNISARAMIASLHVSVWKARKFDSGASDEVTTAKSAESHVARVNKHLFGTRRHARRTTPLFTAVLDAADALRVLHNTETLPWSNRSGDRLLPALNWMTYTEKIRKAGATFTDAADAFVAAYPTLRLDAKAALGELYDIEDFPEPDDVRRRFGYAIEFAPLPTGHGDFRLDLPADHISKIEAEIVERLERTTREAMRDAWARLRESVERIAHASKDGGIVRSTLISNARETCDVLARLNVAEDHDLDRMRERVERELTTIAVDDLRSDKLLRADTEKRANDILQRMTALYAPATDAAA